MTKFLSNLPVNLIMQSRLVGVDLAGETTRKTALAVLDGNIVQLWSTAKVNSELRGCRSNVFDPFALLLKRLNPDFLGIDAPLSLPDYKSREYLYRPATDKKLGAMSPCYIGTLTARGMHLVHHLRSTDDVKLKDSTKIVEVYPSSVVAFLEGTKLAAPYKKSKTRWDAIANAVKSNYGWEIDYQGHPAHAFPHSDHEVDALLALVAVYHFSKDPFYNTKKHYKVMPGGDPTTPFIVPV